MNYLAGVDEAGLGPLLGPLVIGGVTMAGPAGVDPWAALAGRVCRHRSEKGKIRVADSKKVHQGGRGLERLEHTVLSFWGAWQGDFPDTLLALLEALDAGIPALTQCPWYGDLELPLPLCAGRDEVELQAHRLERDLVNQGLEIVQITALPVDAQEFNDLIAATDNKSRAHFDAYSRVIARQLALLPDGGHLVADRCGGLSHYAPALRRMYPAAKLSVLEQGPAVSQYEIGLERRRLRITFAAGGEDRSFPTALASCMAKYLRELMMHLLNRWFAERRPGLKRTAGYYTDGRRFLDDIAPILSTGEFARSLLVRCR